MVIPRSVSTDIVDNVDAALATNSLTCPTQSASTVQR